VNELYEWVRRQPDIDGPELTRPILEAFARLDDCYSDPLVGVVSELMASEDLFYRLPSASLSQLTMAEEVHLERELQLRQRFHEHRNGYVALIRRNLADLFERILNHLPPNGGDALFTVPLVSIMQDPAGLVEEICSVLGGELYDHSLFTKVANQLAENVNRVSGREDNDSRRPVKQPSECGLPPEEMARGYLRNTPFLDLFMAPVPLQLTKEARMSHMMVVGGPGAGKTTLLKHLILHDLKDPAQPSIVIIDPHADIIPELLHADLGLDDRIIYLSPRDIPALNLFDVNRKRQDSYDQHTKEQVRAGVLQTFNFLFASLAGETGELTSKQQILFSYCAELLLLFPQVRGYNATVIDLLELLDDPQQFADVIAELPYLKRTFFERDILPKNNNFRSTREEVGWRLKGILASPTMERLFSAPDTKIDLFDALNSGKVILVDTAKDYLKEGSAIFGRLFITLILQAVMERAALPPSKRRDTLLYVDEASDFFSANIDDLLTEARKFKCGFCCAFQYLGQANVGLRESLLGTTNIKFASQLSGGDARALATEMRTSTDFIMSQPPMHFAAYIRGTEGAVSVSVPKPPRLPQMPEGRYRDFIERNRARVSAPYAPRRERKPMSEPEPPKVENPQEPRIENKRSSKEW
jgi:hypothetical protein